MRTDESFPSQWYFQDQGRIAEAKDPGFRSWRRSVVERIQMLIVLSWELGREEESEKDKGTGNIHLFTMSFQIGRDEVARNGGS